METNAKYIDELELMRQDMNQLRSLLSGQQIVNERLMRRAMNKEISKERRSIFVTIGCAIVGTFVFYSMQPTRIIIGVIKNLGVIARIFFSAVLM